MASAYYVTQKPGLHVIKLVIHVAAMMVFVCTSLHRDLQNKCDYSLGQIDFAVFRGLFAITQLLCQVSTGC